MIMDDKELLDIYTDYLISSFGLTTATGLSRLLDGEISHDRVQRFLASPPQSGKDLWKVVKPFVRQMQSKEGDLIIDDSISEKPFTDENEIMCWHYDHSKGMTIKGINFVSLLYHANDVSLPVDYHLIEKTEFYIDKKTKKEKRRSPITKNEVFQQLLRQAVANDIPFRYVLNDVWFASAKNMMFVKHDIKHDFVMPIKTNRKVALSLDDKKQGRYVRVDNLELEPDPVTTIYLEGVDFPRVALSEARWDGSALHLAAHPQNTASEGSRTTLKLTNVDSTDGWVMTRADGETVALSAQGDHVALELKVDNRSVVVRQS